MDKNKTSEVTRRYVDFLRKNIPNIKRAYLFGSYAKERGRIDFPVPKGNTNADSDIDLAIVFKNLSDTFDMQVQLIKFRRKFDTRIEPHAFRESDFEPSNPLIKEILTTGIEIV